MPVQPIGCGRFAYFGLLLILCAMLAGQAAFSMLPNQEDYFQYGVVLQWPILFPAVSWLILSGAAVTVTIILIAKPMKMGLSKRLWLCLPPTLLCFAGFAIAFNEMAEYYSVV